MWVFDDRMANGEAGSGPFWGKPEWRSEAGYYKMLASSFATLLSTGTNENTALRFLRLTLCTVVTHKKLVKRELWCIRLTAVLCSVLIRGQGETRRQTHDHVQSPDNVGQGLTTRRKVSSLVGACVVRIPSYWV